ncbi:hypothetical protein TNIN_325851 [Trichonephila inaurata madagascariensis]|uniref:Uncharacterized protein n=1 Tax=Trichonephila inaurata madagascariensis TaxID=2747483 RepID=A0A8X6ME63_9ARAC|nr:hypothetical protein TNIN_325851 [Trichonephila inaurata madagascariensis]
MTRPTPQSSLKVGKKTICQVSGRFRSTCSHPLAIFYRLATTPTCRALGSKVIVRSGLRREESLGNWIRALIANHQYPEHHFSVSGVVTDCQNHKMDED